MCKSWYWKCNGPVQKCCEPSWKESRTKDGKWTNKFTKAKAASGQNQAQKSSFEGVPASILTPEQRQQKHAEEYGKLVREDKKLADGIEFTHC